MRGKLNRLERAMRGKMDYLELTDGTRYYFDPMDVAMKLFLEGLEKGYRSTVKDTYTPPIRAALVKATPSSRARFEEKYGPAVRECGVVHSEERITVRRIELDGSVTAFVVEGEAARERLQDLRSGRNRGEPTSLSAEGVREIDPTEDVIEDPSE